MEDNGQSGAVAPQNEGANPLQVGNSIGESQNGTQEGQAQEQKQEPVKKDPTASRFAALTKKQREHLQAVEAFKKEKEAFDNQKKGFLENKSNPIAALQSLGWSYEDATNYVLEGKVPNEVVQRQEKTELELRLEKIENETKEKEAQEKEKQYNQDLNTFKQAVEGYLADHTDEYAFLSAEKEPAKLILEFIQEVYNSTGEEIQVEAAGKEIEALLEKEAYESYEKLQSNKKVKTKYNIAQGEPSSNKVEPKVNTGSKTLTSQMGASSSNPAKVMTDEERLAESIRILSGQK